MVSLIHFDMLSRDGACPVSTIAYKFLTTGDKNENIDINYSIYILNYSF